MRYILGIFCTLCNFLQILYQAFTHPSQMLSLESACRAISVKIQAKELERLWLETLNSRAWESGAAKLIWLGLMLIFYLILKFKSSTANI